MSSQILVLLWLLLLLCLVDVFVLSNLVFSGSSLPKLAQDHKVSICKKDSRAWKYISHIHIICSDAYSQDTCNTLLTLSCLHIHMLLYSTFTWLHTCRGSLCMLHVFPKLYLLFSISLSKALMYVVINYQKGGDWKHKCSLGGFGN